MPGAKSRTASGELSKAKGRALADLRKNHQYFFDHLYRNHRKELRDPNVTGSKFRSRERALAYRKAGEDLKTRHPEEYAELYERHKAIVRETD